MRRASKRTVVLAAVGALALAALAGCGGSSSHPATAQTKAPAGAGSGSTAATTTRFRGTVREGPDRGLTLAGEMPRAKLHLTPSGQLTGTLVSRSGTVPIGGEITPAGMTLRFKLAGGRVISGHGTVRRARPPQTLLVARTGSLRGPRAGDKGDWVLAAALDGTYVGKVGTDPR